MEFHVLIGISIFVAGCYSQDKIPTHCPSGLPELPGYNCGRSPQRRECPSTHYCEISPVDAYAVCCPNKRSAPIDHCAENDCAKDEKCIPEPKNCFTTPCPQYRCKKGYTPIDHCAENDCAKDEKCIPAPKSCFTTPCPQYRCEKGSAPIDHCAENDCAKDEKCIPAPKNCFTTPCPQYRCEKEPRLPCPLVRCANPCKFGQKRDPKTGCNGCECNEDKCGSNEVFKRCGGCESTCENDGRLVACPEICRLNTCQCASGYVRDANKRCILPRECPLKAGNIPNICNLQPKPGPCEAYIPSFFYEPNSKSCKPFIYGGCQGNDNRFPNEADCLEKCDPNS